VGQSHRLGVGVVAFERLLLDVPQANRALGGPLSPRSGWEFGAEDQLLTLSDNVFYPLLVRL